MVIHPDEAESHSVIIFGDVTYEQQETMRSVMYVDIYQTYSYNSTINLWDLKDNFYRL